VTRGGVAWRGVTGFVVAVAWQYACLTVAIFLGNAVCVWCFLWIVGYLRSKGALTRRDVDNVYKQLIKVRSAGLAPSCSRTPDSRQDMMHTGKLGAAYKTLCISSGGGRFGRCGG
jgi:hypothetical protein